MKKSLTPKQAYRLLKQVADRNKMTVSGWAEKCGVKKGTVSHWKCRSPRTVLVSTLERLGIEM